jgi:hypothetical protein
MSAFRAAAACVRDKLMAPPFAAKAEPGSSAAITMHKTKRKSVRFAFGTLSHFCALDPISTHYVNTITSAAMARRSTQCAVLTSGQKKRIGPLEVCRCGKEVSWLRRQTSLLGITSF